MNERITLLAKQASTFAFTEYPKQTMATFNTNKSVEQLFNQKFAELIVAECVDIVEHSRIQGDEGVCLVGATKNKIKQHFGVEQ